MRTRRLNIVYSDEEMAWLEQNKTLPIRDYHASFTATFNRADVSAEHLHGLRKRKGWRTGRTGRFVPGQESPTKGKPSKGAQHPNSVRTRFQKGARPHTFRGPGHESVDKFGYVWIVIDERNPWTGASTRRIHKHRWRWEQANGPVPKGMALKCIGDRQNTDPSNWELVPRGLLPRLNGKSGRDYDRAPAELKPTIMAMAKLEHQVLERRRAEEKHHE